MKKYILLFLSFFICPLVGAQAGKGGLLPMPTAEEMREIEQFLKTLSPEEIKELEAIGEEIIKNAEEKNIPLFDTTPPQPKKNPRPKQKAPAPKQKPKVEVKTNEKTLNKKQKTALQKMIANLVEAVASIRQKATSDENLIQKLSSLNSQLNDLTYYLNVVNYSKHLVQLTQKEFTPLKDALTKLSDDMVDLDDSLNVPELATNKKATPQEQKERRRKLKDAERIVQRIISTLVTSFEQKHILKDLERLLKKYEPEALKIKQEQEKKEKRAKNQAANTPTTNTGRVISAGSRYGSPTQRYTGRGGYAPGRGGYTGGGNLGSHGGGVKSSPTGKGSGSTPNNGGKGGNPKGNTPNNKKDGSKDPKDTNQNHKLTELEKAAQHANDIKKKLKDIDAKVGQNKDRLHNFIDTYLADTKASVDEFISEEIDDVIDIITWEAGRVKSEITKWLGKVNKNSTSVTEYKSNVKQMKEFIKDNFNEAHEINKKMKDITFSAQSPRAQKHQGKIKHLNKRIDDISKELDKPL